MCPSQQSELPRVSLPSGMRAYSSNLLSTFAAIPAVADPTGHNAITITNRRVLLCFEFLRVLSQNKNDAFTHVAVFLTIQGYVLALLGRHVMAWVCPRTVTT